MKSMIACLAACCAATPLLAVEPPASQSDVTQIIKLADEATKKVEQASYNHKVFGLDGLEQFVPARQGQVKELRKKTMEASPFWVETDDPATDGPPGSAPQLIVSFDGENLYRLDNDARQLKWGVLSEGANQILEQTDTLGVMLEFIHPTPFQDEIDAISQKLEGQQTIGGVKCDVVYVVYSVPDPNQVPPEARWFFSQKDHLPRRVERVFPSGGRLVTEVYDLDVKTKIEPDIFALKAPEGFTTVKFEPPAQEPEPDSKLLALGSDAPAFALANPSGETVSLADLRGNVVLIDFWATWCEPCRRAMPGIQAIHEKFKDKKVRVLGVNVWEGDGADPAKFMKDNNYTYGLLLKGNDVANAYQVKAIPTFYIIDPQGKIAYAGEGFAPGSDKEIEKTINDLLGKDQN